MNRRDVLHSVASAVLTSVVLPRAVLAQAAGSGSIMEALSTYMASAGTRPLPADVAEHAKHHLLDTLAAMLSGSQLAPGQAAERYVRDYAGTSVATIAGTTLTATAGDAALANGVMAHADETDDSHNPSRSHPGCAVVPAALAAGEQFAIDGVRFLNAVTLGYDIGTRVVMAMGGAAFSYESSLSTHSIAGTFGAAAAAVCAAGLDPLGPRLRGAAVIRDHRLAARHRSHREGIRVRRQAGAQRCHVSTGGARWLERR
jgi:hypothetical protein